MVGLEKLLIPVREEELTLEKIQEYLPTVMDAFNRNARKARAEYEKFKGQHDILQKVRPNSDTQEINHKVVEQHLWAMVNFKCGYAYGNPLEFAKKETADVNEMSYFNKYMSSVNFRGLCDNVAEWVYTTGAGYLFTQPKKSDDLEYDAPFEIYSMPTDRVAKVYSSYIGEKPLFDLVCTPIKKLINNGVEDYTILSIYTPDMYYEFEYQTQVGANLKPTKIEQRNGYKLLPITEFYAYSSRVGMVESLETLQNALDSIDSDSLDNIQETVNQLLIFINAKLGDTNEEKRQTLVDARKNGALEVFDQSKDIHADVKTLVTQLNHTDVNVLKNQLKADMYASWGVPLAMSGIRSGNVTQGGSEVSNGWEHAYSTILKENNNMMTGFRTILRTILWICNKMPDSRVKSLNEGDIEIKYNIARSNNMLTKTQSYGNLVDRDVPPDIALALCELTGDPHSMGKMIEEYKAKKQAEQEAREEKLARQNQGINSGDTENIQRTNTEVVKRQENEE